MVRKSSTCTSRRKTTGSTHPTPMTASAEPRHSRSTDLKKVSKFSQGVNRHETNSSWHSDYVHVLVRSCGRSAAPCRQTPAGRVSVGRYQIDTRRQKRRGGAKPRTTGQGRAVPE